MEGSREAPAARMLLAILYSGLTNPDKLCKVTGEGRTITRLRCQRLRDNGVIVNPRTLDICWDHEDWKIANVSFICDVLVAMGHIERGARRDEKGQPTYITRSGSEATRPAPKPGAAGASQPSKQGLSRSPRSRRSAGSR
jgi:hypothetical protein